MLLEQRKLNEAAAQFERAVSLKPSLFQAHFNLGNIHWAQVKLDQAVARYQQTIALAPDLAEAHNNLGAMLRNQRKPEQALARFEQAIALKPDYAEAYHNLGNALKDLGRFEQAAARYEQALALNPRLVQTHNNLGIVLRNLGKLEQAAAQFEQVIALADHANACNRLADVRKELGQLDQAEAMHERALALMPHAHNNLGNMLREQGKVDQAVARYQQALALKPDYAEAHNNLGIVLVGQNRLDEAVARFEQAIALRSDLVETYKNLGAASCSKASSTRRRARYDQALALRPDYAEVHYHRTELKTFQAGDTDLAALETLAAEGDRLPPGKMLFAHFALSKALEDVGDYPRAFEHLLKANALRRREVDYDEAACLETFRDIADVFDAGLLERFAGVGDPSPVPIFVLGMFRSGSTLVEQILASHPQVHAAGELKAMDRVLRSVSGSDGRPVPFPQCMGQFDSEGLRRLGQAYLAKLPALGEGETRVTDKTPLNFVYVGLIRLILPNARIIHTMRNPVDTCVSCFSRYFALDATFSFDLAELGRYYRAYHELMAHWRTVLPAGAMLDVSYEEVVDNLEEQARRLIDFCGLPWDDRCLSFHKTSRPIATASNVQVRRPVYRSSVERWRRYEAYLQPLLAEIESCR